MIVSTKAGTGSLFGLIYFIASFYKRVDFKQLLCIIIVRLIGSNILVMLF
jgi:hypothetical protein